MHLEFSGNKIALFSDLHLGIGQNSQTRLNIAQEFIDHFISHCEKRKVTEIIFLGDFFHNRQSLDPRVLHIAAEIIQKLKDFQIIFLVGNHDSYYKNTAEITPVKVFQRSNIHIVSPSFLTLSFKNTKNQAFCCSWGVTLEQLQELIQNTNVKGKKICFGHFEVISFLENNFHECQKGFSPKELLDLVDHVYSGHFHFPSKKEYKEGKKIVYLGSPFQLNFGDRQSDRFFYFWDPQTLELEAVENTISPKHYKFFVSSILQNPQRFIPYIKNNFIELNVDDIKSYEKKHLEIMSLLEQSIYYRISFTPTLSSLGNEENSSLSSQNLSLVDLPTIFQAYIEESTCNHKFDLISYLMTIYKQAQDMHQDLF